MIKRNLLLVATFVSFISVSSAYSADFGIKFAWCESTPEFTLSNVPKGTTKLDLRMVDLDRPSSNHGGAVVDFKKQKKIQCGSFSDQNWYPPSPPSGSHTYKWTVTAQDQDGKDLGTATAERKFPEL